MPMNISSMRRTTRQIFVALGCASGALACSSEAPTSANAVSTDVEEPGSTSGQLAEYIATNEDGTSETSYFLRIASGEELRLTLHQPIDADPGSVIRVWGKQGIGEIDVSSYRLVAPVAPSGDIGSSSAPLIGGAPLADRNFCVVLVDLNGVAVSVTSAAAATQFFDGATSIDSYYRENSYGVQGVDGKVYGPFPYTMATCANADTNALATAMRAQVAAQDPAVNCTQYAYIFTKTNVCAFGGLGAVGSPTAPARDTWYNGSISCVVTVQEPGHNFGMQHSSSMACPGTTFADDPNTCTHSEYGDLFDPMGSGCRHMNVWQKEYQQWFGGCNSIKVTATGDFTLSPTELPCSGPQALQIPMPHTRPFTRPAAGGGAAGTDTITSYYLEYRTAVGFDNGTRSPFATPTVLLHAGADYKTLVTGTRARNTGVHTWLLDMHPAAAGAAANFNDAGFKVGETFTDPAGGLTVTVTAMDATSATVHVEVTGGTGAPTCLDGTTYVPSATQCSGPTGGAGDAGGGSVIVPPPPDAGSTPVARADAGRDASTGTAAPDSGTAGGGTGGAAGAAGAAGAGGGAGGGTSTTGTGGTGAGATGTGGTGQAGTLVNQDAATSNSGPPSVTPVEGGCSCRVGAAGAPANRSNDVAAGFMVLLGLAGARLRRRGARGPGEAGAVPTVRS
jgi:MYXO-CTERM domain-containing protein